MAWENLMETRFNFKRKLNSLIAIASNTESKSEGRLKTYLSPWNTRRKRKVEDGGDILEIEEEQEWDSSVKFSPIKSRNLMKAFTCAHVAHEIAINPDYRLEPIPNGCESDTSGEENNIQTVFWELLEEEIKTGTDLEQTVGVIGESKQEILSLMMPQNWELREDVDKVLDSESIREKIASKEFDYKYYADYILSVLKKICCPSRDNEIFEIGLLKSPSRIFKRIFSLLELMKIDMENFFIGMSRPYITKYAIEKERKKIADYLELEYRIHEDGLSATRAWFLRHKRAGRDIGVVLAKAYGDVLRTRDNSDWPETFLRDVPKLKSFQERLKKISIIGAIVLEVSNVAKKLFKNSPPELPGVFSRYMKVLADKVDVTSSKALQACLEKVGEEAVEVAERTIKKRLKRRMTSADKYLIYEAVTKVIRPENHYTGLLSRRAIDYAEELIASGNEYHVPLPPSLMVVMNEVALLMLDFLRVVFHNQCCFDDLYRDILEDRAPPPVFPPKNGGNWDIRVLRTLRNLREDSVMGPSRSVELDGGSERLQRNFEKERLFLQEAYRDAFQVHAACKKCESNVSIANATYREEAEGSCCPSKKWYFNSAASDSCLDERERRHVRFEDDVRAEYGDVPENFAKHYRTCCPVISQDITAFLRQITH